MTFAQMSTAGALIIAVGIIARALWINCLPKKTFLLFWETAVIRLLVPFSVPFMFSIFSVSEKGGVKNRSIAPEIIPAVESGENVTVDIPLIYVIWAAGVLISGSFFILMYLKCCREFKTSIPDNSDFIKGWLKERRLNRNVSVRWCDRITSPLTYGIFRPVILLPKTHDLSNTIISEYVLEHEYTHIRRFDSARKVLLIAVLCVHWFNPLVWVMYVLANRDIELVCDELTIRHFGEDAKAGYAKALIAMEEKRSKSAPMFNSFSGNAAEERIVSIMKFKKASFFTVALSSALIIGTTAAFATSADNASGHTVPEQNPNPGYDYSMRDSDGNDKNIAESTVKRAGRLIPDENGNYIPSPDNEADNLLGSSEIEIFEFHEGDTIYIGGTVAKDSPKSRISEEQMKKYIEDIESGKIKPIEEMPEFADSQIIDYNECSEIIKSLPSSNV